MKPRIVLPLSIPLACLIFCVALCGAIWAADRWGSGWLLLGSLLCLGAGGGLLLSATRGRGPPRLLLGLAVAGLGVWRAGDALSHQSQPWTQAPAGVARLIAVVDAPVEARGAAALVFARVERVDRPLDVAAPQGRIRLTVPPLPPVGVGDRIEVVGRFEAVQRGALGAERMLAQGVVATSAYPQLWRSGESAAAPWDQAANAARVAVRTLIESMLPEPQSGLLSGLLIGSTSGMSDEFRLALSASGTTHLVVVSGYNISLVGALLFALVSGQRRSTLIVPVVGIWLFALVAGGGAPTVRAAFMGTVGFALMRAGRGADALGALALTAAGMLALDPLLAVDVSFQLSTLATVGVVALSPRIEALLSWGPEWLRSGLAVTVAAQLATLPVMASTFNQVSLVAPLSNLAIGSLIPVATIGGALALPLVFIAPLFAGALGFVLLIPTTIMVKVIEISALVPGATLPLGEVASGIVLVYATVLIAWTALPTPEGRDFMASLGIAEAGPGVLAALALGIAPAILSASALSAAPPPLIVTVLDVGQGDAVLIRGPSQRTLLIDGGPSPPAVLSQIGRRLGLLERELSAVVLTRAGAEALPGAVAVGERYAPALFMAPSDRSPSGLYARWLDAAGPRLMTVDSPTVVALEPGVEVELYPTEPVAGSDGSAPQRTLVVRVRYGETSFLISPSVGAEQVRGALKNPWPLRADVLLVPRHGDASSLSPSFLAQVRPSLAVISSGMRARFRTPAQNTLDTLGDIPTFRTDLNGSVELRSDGRHITVAVDRASAASEPAPRVIVR